jgi:hypothetical protein
LTFNSVPEEEPDTSWHAATDPQKCLDMEKKYGWKLLRIKPIAGNILKVRCIFQGKTRFPNYLENEEDN